MLTIPQARPDDVWLTDAGPRWRGTRQGDGTRSANVKCGNGHVASLSEHVIADDGTITPSLLCGVRDCDWHHHARLEGWAP